MVMSASAQGPVAPALWNAGVHTSIPQSVSDVLGEHDATLDGALLRRVEDALANGAAVGTGESLILLVLDTGDHEPGGDLHLAQYVALLVLGLAGQVLVGGLDVIGLQDLSLIGRFDEFYGIGEWRQADA